MIATSIRHAPSCTQDEGFVREDPKPGVGVVVFRCRKCGAAATTKTAR